MTDTKVTKAEALQIAKRQLSYGHFADGFSTLYTRCKTCGERVERAWSALDGFRPHSAGHQVALRAQLVEHILTDCEVMPY